MGLYEMGQKISMDDGSSQVLRGQVTQDGAEDTRTSGCPLLGATWSCGFDAFTDSNDLGSGATSPLAPLGVTLS